MTVRPKPDPTETDKLASLRLGWARAALGTLFVLRTTPLLAPFHLWFLTDVTPLFGWPSSEWAPDAFGPALPAVAVEVLCIVRTAAAFAFALGWRTRPAGLVAGTSGYLVLFQNPFEFLLTLHLLYLGTILLSLSGAGSAFALRPEPARHPVSGLWLMRLFVASIYMWAGIAKLRLDWIDGRTLELFHRSGALRGALADLLLATPGLRSAMASAVIAAELALGPLLLVSRTRRFGLLAAICLHGVLEVVAQPDFFGWEMLSLLVCFWPDAWLTARSEQTVVATR